MDNILDVVVSAFKGVGKEKAFIAGKELRARLESLVESTDPKYDDDLVDILNSLLDGFINGEA